MKHEAYHAEPDPSFAVRHLLVIFLAQLSISSKPHERPFYDPPMPNQMKPLERRGRNGRALGNPIASKIFIRSLDNF